MTTLDDKLLGEKTENYCSSSEDEREEEDESGSASPPRESLTQNPGLSSSKIDINDTSRWKGYSQNTGPKGVIRDFQLFKEHQANVRVQNEQKLAEEIKKHSITCKAYEDGVEGGDPEIDELMSDEVLQGFVNKRMGELMKIRDGVVGPFIVLGSGDEFLRVVDEVGGKGGIVVVVICDDSGVSAALEQGVKECSLKYRDVQFCSVKASVVGVSLNFKRKGVPAVLVYDKGELVGNYVAVKDEIGDEFDSIDVIEWLEGKGVLGGGSVNGGIRGK